MIEKIFKNACFQYQLETRNNSTKQEKVPSELEWPEVLIISYTAKPVLCIYCILAVGGLVPRAGECASPVETVPIRCLLTDRLVTFNPGPSVWKAIGTTTPPSRRNPNIADNK